MIGDFYGDGNRYRGEECVAPSETIMITICDVCIVSGPDGEEES